MGLLEPSSTSTYKSFIHFNLVLTPCIYSCFTPLASQGKGEFTMEYMKHSPVAGDIKRELLKKYEAERLAERK